MRRWAFHMVAGVSAVLGIVAMAGWMRSYGAVDDVGLAKASMGKAGGVFRLYYLKSSRGELEAGRYVYRCPDRESFKDLMSQYGGRWSFWHEPDRPFILAAGFKESPSFWKQMGFRSINERRTSRGHGVSTVGVRVPFWTVVAATTLVSLAWAARWAMVWRRSRRRIRSGFCTGCGYDLRASRERCPECGKPIPVATK